jgi:hypothetical protein
MNNSSWERDMPIYMSNYTGAQIDENLGKGASALQAADVKNDLVSTDTNKPLSAAQGKALEDNKAPIASPTFTGTVGGITATHVGLGNVDNTSDADKPVSTAQQAALDLKASLSALHATALLF